MEDTELSLNERKVLLALAGKGPRSPEELLEGGGFTEMVEVMSAASWLKSKGLLDIHRKSTPITFPTRKESSTSRGESFLSSRC